MTTLSFCSQVDLNDDIEVFCWANCYKSRLLRCNGCKCSLKVHSSINETLSAWCRSSSIALQCSFLSTWAPLQMLVRTNSVSWMYRWWSRSVWDCTGRKMKNFLQWGAAVLDLEFSFSAGNHKTYFHLLTHDDFCIWGHRPVVKDITRISSHKKAESPQF